MLRQSRSVSAVPAPRKKSRRNRWIFGAVGMVALVAAAIFWPAYDKQDTPREESSLWAVQQGATGKIARINTGLLEVDTVKAAPKLSGIAQLDAQALVFTNSYHDLTVIDPAKPEDLEAEVDTEGPSTPEGTENVLSAGDHLLFVGNDGALFTAPVDNPADVTAINPDSEVEVKKGEDPPVFAAASANITEDGTVVAVEDATTDEFRVILADAATGEVSLEETLTLDLGDRPQVGMVGGQWAVLNPQENTLWVGGEDRSATFEGGLEQDPRLAANTEDNAYVADSSGLWEISGENLSVDRIVEVPQGSKPAAPTSVGQHVYAAWLATGDGGGTLWSTKEGEEALDYGEETLEGEPTPEFVTNGVRTILNDTGSGWVWVLPTGELVPSSQNWAMDDEIIEQTVSDKVEEVDTLEPPVAVDDSFGVRAGQTTSLQVLLNDYDPNKDILTIDPESVEGLDPDFGTVTLAQNNQLLSVKVKPKAQGSASFKYRVTDGTSTGASKLATVKLTVKDGETQAPKWCGVEGCLAQWPSPTLAPGNSVTVPVLPGWVDPQGDALTLESVENPQGVGTAIANPDGTLTYYHPPLEGKRTKGQTVPLNVTVANSQGKTSTEVIKFKVTEKSTLKMDQIVALGVVGEPLVVDFDEHVSGANGKLVLEDATAIDAKGTEIRVSNRAARLTFEGKEAGSYLLDVTVADENEAVNETIRIELVDKKDAQVTTKPTTVFVPPGEDVTVDVLTTVTDPANRVLVLQDLDVKANSGAQLKADLIQEELIHASGTTKNGEPGLLGTATYKVSDGTTNEKANATGEVTFMLLPEAELTEPIVQDQWETVPAGSQINLPVLKDAVVPAGAQLAVDPGSVTNNQKEGLAFATRDTLRYLAPEEPGEYTVDYTVYTIGDPELNAPATATFTVTSPEDKAELHKETLEGRALAGETITIPLTENAAQRIGSGVELDSIARQPSKGSATVSAQGDAIEYTAKPGESGADRFTYRARNLEGATVEAPVEITILDQKPDPTPVTFSDYVQLGVGADNEATIYPTNNDIDPTGDGLQLVDVAPNLPETADDYKTQEERISYNEEDGEVTVKAGEELGTSSFVYTVENTKGDRATGLIITKIVRGNVPDYPSVQDTRLDTQTLQELPSGVDVIKDKVVWNTGNPETLDLKLWDNGELTDKADKFTATGQSISGPAPEETTLVPFQASGVSSDGEEVETYAFLRIPGSDDIRLSLNPEYEEVEVDEGSDITVQLANAITIPSGKTLEIDTEGVHASGARAEGKCTASDKAVTYTAGKGEPWTDQCTLPVKLKGQDEYTFLSMGIRVIPEDGQPEMVDASITVSPGKEESYDLQQMVTWEGEPAPGPLSYQVSAPSGNMFAVDQNGNTLTVKADDKAVPSRQETVQVSLSDYPDVDGGTLTLVVGPAPDEKPQGGTVVKECIQADGTSCDIVVVGDGVDGQTNPYSEPLKLVEVSDKQSCSGVNFSVANSTTVTASWSKDAAGIGGCQARFTVEDAQGNRSTGEKQGTIIFDLLGFPSSPTHAEWVGYTGDSVTVQARGAASSYPKITGYKWSTGNNSGSCSADGRCTISGLTPGKKQKIEIRSENSVGQSRSAATVEAWAYKPPAAPVKVDWRPVPNGTTGKKVELTVRADSGTKELQVSGHGTVPVTPGSTNTTFTMDVGTNSRSGTDVKITPISSVPLPTPSGGSATGKSLIWSGLHGIGAPTVQLKAGKVSSDGSVTFTAEVTDRNGASDQDLQYSFNVGGQQKSFSGSNTASYRFTNANRVTVSVKARAYRNGNSFGESSTQTLDLRRPVDTPAAGTYRVSSTPQVSAGRRPGGQIFTWSTLEGNLPALPQGAARLWYGTTSEHPSAADWKSLVPSEGGKAPDLWTFGCQNGTTWCSDGAPFTPATNLSRLRVSFDWEDGGKCPGRLGSASFDKARDVRYYDLSQVKVNMTESAGDSPGRKVYTWTVELPGGAQYEGSSTLTRSCYEDAP